MRLARSPAGKGPRPTVAHGEEWIAMAAVHRGDTSIGPVATFGRTITLVARTRAVHLGSDARGALHLRARPLHVEVLDHDGRREVVRIRDVERTLMSAIVLAGIAGVGAARALRRRGRP